MRSNNVVGVNNPQSGVTISNNIVANMFNVASATLLHAVFKNIIIQPGTPQTRD